LSYLDLVGNAIADDGVKGFDAQLVLARSAGTVHKAEDAGGRRPLQSEDDKRREPQNKEGKGSNVACLAKTYVPRILPPVDETSSKLKSAPDDTRMLRDVRAVTSMTARSPTAAWERKLPCKAAAVHLAGLMRSERGKVEEDHREDERSVRLKEKHPQQTTPPLLPPLHRNQST
jgi:hypothetical protein